jgi:hypothetical protein
MKPRLWNPSPLWRAKRWIGAGLLVAGAALFALERCAR